MVVSHKIEIGAVQKDGRLSIVERYQRDDGSEAMFCSQVDPKTDLDAYAADRIKRLDEEEAAPKPAPDPFDVKVDAARAAYQSGDYDTAKVLLSEAGAAVDDKAIDPIGEVKP